MADRAVGYVSALSEHLSLRQATSSLHTEYYNVACECFVDIGTAETFHEAYTHESCFGTLASTSCLSTLRSPEDFGQIREQHE